MEDSPEGCFGVLRIQKQMFCLTLEPPDQANKAWTSCIPVQQYICTEYESEKFGPTWLVREVPGREAIVFHAGNWVTETQGCILLGDSLLHLSGRRGVANSRNTFKKFKDVLAGQQELHLTISVGY
jgi:hypothetical protein